MKIPFHKNQKGFSHHLLLPVIAILLVAGIGGYVMLRSSSAATRVNCNDRTIGFSWTHCQRALKDLKTYYIYYDLRLQKKDAKYKYLNVALKPSTRKYDSGRTTIKTTPFNWSVNCFNKAGVSKFKSRFYRDGKPGTVKVPKEYTRCGVNVMYYVNQYGPVNGYIHKTTGGYSHSVYLK